MLLRDIIETAAKTAGCAPNEVDIEAVIAGYTDEDIAMLHAAMKAEEDAIRFGRAERLFPDDGPVRRALYPKHMEFFWAGQHYQSRLFQAANRVGKSVAGAFEVRCHLTGRYPPWWPGKRFGRPGRWWAAGTTTETTRDILQLELLGEPVTKGYRKIMDGSGLIDRECLGEPTWRRNITALVDTIPIRHKTGGWSSLGLKSFEQGRSAFEGTAKEGIWLDEEAPEDIYGECVIRTATTGGLILLTFTPLQGITPLVKSFRPTAK